MLIVSNPTRSRRDLECFRGVTDVTHMHPAQAQSLFYVFHQGVQSGPISLVEIAARIRAHTLELNDYLYDESASDWIFLAAHRELSELIKDVKLEVREHQKKVAAASNAPDEWFALRGELRFGPFAYTELVRLLQEKTMHDSDYVWHTGLKEWKMVSDLPDFSPEAIRKLLSSGLVKSDQVFFRRRHGRVSHDCSILMHNNQKVFRGKGLEISAGGAGIVLENANLDVGHQVFLHFKPGSDLPAFNSLCEITSRRAVNASEVVSPVLYGVKFIKIESKTKNAIEALAARQPSKRAS